MFLEFYQLPDNAFGVTPDPGRFYLGSSHREALASLLYGLRCGRGFLAVVAKPGMGKTTMLFCLLEHLRDSARTALIFQTQCNPTELLRHLLTDLGIRPASNDTVTMHYQLNNLLLREAERGRQVVVMIDEAQDLSEETLESIRLLSNFEKPSAKLIQIILAGQPPLADKLALPQLVQLQQRVAILARIEPLSRVETERYIRHRLNLCGYKGPELFDSGAFDLIAEASEGIPRRINALCFNALSIGCALRKTRIDAEIVREAAADLDISSLRYRQPAVRSPVVAGDGNGQTETDNKPGPRKSEKDAIPRSEFEEEAPVRSEDGWAKEPYGFLFGHYARGNEPSQSVAAPVPQAAEPEERIWIPAEATGGAPNTAGERPAPTVSFLYPCMESIDAPAQGREPEPPCSPGINDPLPVYTLPTHSNLSSSTPNLASHVVSQELREIGWGFEHDWHIWLGALLLVGGFAALWQQPPLLMLGIGLWVAAALILTRRKQPPEDWESPSQAGFDPGHRRARKAGSAGWAIAMAAVVACLIAVLFLAPGRTLTLIRKFHFLSGERMPAHAGIVENAAMSVPRKSPAETNVETLWRQTMAHGHKRAAQGTQLDADPPRPGDGDRVASDPRRMAPAVRPAWQDNAYVDALLERQARVLQRTTRRPANILHFGQITAASHKTAPSAAQVTNRDRSSSIHQTTEIDRQTSSESSPQQGFGQKSAREVSEEVARSGEPAAHANAPKSAIGSIEVDENVQKGRLIEKVQPQYPEAAKEAGVSGNVVLRAFIAKNGTIELLRYISGPRPLIRAAMAAVEQWRYLPTFSKGKPVEVETTITVHF